MLRTLLLALLGAPLLVLLAGCCGNNACDCQDLLADSLYFSFDGTQFSRHELNTVYLARYDNTTHVNLDSLPLPQRQRRLVQYTRNYMGQDTTGLLLLSNNAPFSVRTSGTNLSRYFYRLYVPQDSVPNVFYKKPRYLRFVITDISLVGGYQADGCCTCYRNTQKRVRVSGGGAGDSLRNVTENLGYPRVIRLTR